MRSAGGIHTFLFTDIEGSTRMLVERSEQEYADALHAHRESLREAFARHGGREQGTEGDSFFVVFDRPSAAIAAAVEGQRALADSGVAVRVGIHTGGAIFVNNEPIGLAVHHAARVMAAGHGGQILVSEPAAALLSDDATAGLVLRPLGRFRLKDLPEPQRLFQVEASGLVRDFPPLRTLELRPHNLPAALTDIVGRHDDIQRAAKRLADDRLVTLVGPGGVGKTRLSLEVGAQVLDSFAEGVWFVDLSRLARHGAVLPVIAGVLGVKEEGLDPVVEAAGGARLLIVDNCEHVAQDAATTVAALLDRCPELKVLATSREALAVPGEHTIKLAPLAVPAAESGLDDVASEPSVRLLVERIAAVRPEYEPSAVDLPHLGSICRHLDGLPLALELAAARFSVLSAAQVDERLANRFKLLTGGGRLAQDRQQTLQALIDWSYELLNDSERAALRRLSVFAAGCDLDAAESVLSSNGVDAADVIDLLSALDAKSLLVTHHTDAGPRYRLLESIRAYAAERMDADERSATEGRLLGHFLAVAREARPHLERHGQVEWLPRLYTERPNIRVALEAAACEPALAPKGLELVLATWPSWRRVRSESFSWLDKLFDRDADLPPALRADALDRLVERFENDFAAAQPVADEALAVARLSGDDVLVLRTLLSAASARAFAGRAQEEVAALVDEAMAVADRLADPWARSEALSVAAITAMMQGDFSAMARIGEALEFATEAGHLQMMEGLGMIAKGPGGSVEAKPDDVSAAALDQQITFALDRAQVDVAAGLLAQYTHLPDADEGRAASQARAIELLRAVDRNDHASARALIAEIVDTDARGPMMHVFDAVIRSTVAASDLQMFDVAHWCISALDRIEELPPMVQMAAHAQRVDLHLLEGHVDAARDELRKLVEFCSKHPAPIPPHGLVGQVLLAEGDRDGARQAFLRGAAFALTSGLEQLMGSTAPFLADVMADVDAPTAARLLGVAEWFATEVQRLKPLARLHCGNVMTALSRELGDEALRALIAEGRDANVAMLLTEIVDRWTDDDASTGSRSPST